MPWQLLIAISVVGTSAITLLQRALLRQQKYDPIAYSVFFLTIASIFMIGYAILAPAGQPAVVQTPYINMITSSVLYGIGIVLTMKSLRKVSASKFAILYSSRAVWSAALAALLLSESLTWVQVLGSVLVLTAVYILNPLKKRSLEVDSSSLLVLLAAAIFGIAFVNDALAVKSGYSVPLYVAVTTLGVVIFILLSQPTVWQKLRPMFSNSLFIKAALLTGSLHALQAITIYLAFQRGHNASVLAMLNQLQTALIVLGGIILLREYDSLERKLISMAIAFCGLVLLVL